ncbi:MAG: peptidylprolyl isomerase [Patescibacteria group bacterium]
MIIRREDLFNIIIVVAVIGAAIWAAIYFATLAKDSQNEIKPTQIDNLNAKKVTIKTNLGNIDIELFTDKAPITVGNFLKLAESDFYNNTKFHRVIKGFMIQGGDPISKDDSLKEKWGTGGPGYAFKDEKSDEAMVRGIVAMANAGPDTNGSQFFIITAKETSWLSGKHTPFGRVIGGMEVVDAIENLKTDSADRPMEPVVIEDIALK